MRKQQSTLEALFGVDRGMVNLVLTLGEPQEHVLGCSLKTNASSGVSCRLRAPGIKQEGY